MPTHSQVYYLCKRYPSLIKMNTISYNTYNAHLNIHLTNEQTMYKGGPVIYIDPDNTQTGMDKRTKVRYE